MDMQGDPFAGNTEVGGIPFLIYHLRNYLHKKKKVRDRQFAILAAVLMYVTYSFYNMARRPFAVVTVKIIEECEHPIAHKNHTWCQEKFFEAKIEEFMGFLNALFIGSYGVFLFISGFIADIYNPRYYITTGCLMSGFFCALLGLSYAWEIRSFKFFTMVLVLFGASQATGWPVVLSCVTHWYTGGKRGIFFGVWNTHNYLGSVLGIYLAHTWIDTNWGLSFFIPGAILAFMGIVLYLCMVADPKDMKKLNESSKSHTTVNRAAKASQPTWLSTNTSISMYHAVRLPGVIEFSLSMFFSRMVGYTFLFWLPTRVTDKGVAAQISAYYLLAYVIGGSLGGIFAGMLVDLFRRSVVVCAAFLLVSIPVLGLGLISELGANLAIDLPLYMLLGLAVEAPYVVTSTSVSADLGTHKMIKRNHRALSTIGGIVEGTGAIGAAFGVYICGTVHNWADVIYMLMAIQLVASLCLGRQAYKDWKRSGSLQKVFTAYADGFTFYMAMFP